MTNPTTLNTIFDRLFEIYGKLNQNIDAQAKTLGYTTKEYLVLLDVMTHQGTSQQAVCDRLGIKKSAASKLISTLETSGQLTRKACPTNRRESKLYLENKETLTKLCKETALLKTFDADCTIDLEAILKALDALETMLLEPLQ